MEENVICYECTTFANTYRFIEGYLLKDIANQHLFKNWRRHLRYFRIVFSTGKFNIKTCKDSS